MRDDYDYLVLTLLMLTYAYPATACGIFDWPPAAPLWRRQRQLWRRQRQLSELLLRT